MKKKHRPETNHGKLALTIPVELIDSAAMMQIDDILSLECVKRLAIMPDVHAGYDMPIGGVALLDDVISPSFVGYDIGCGMIHYSVGKEHASLFASKEDRLAVYKMILHRVPVGVGAKRQNDTSYPGLPESTALPSDIRRMIESRAQSQVGTLGGGNHFIELGVNTSGAYGITIHSGSRGAGHGIAEFYMGKGRLLPLASELGQAYLADMEWALQLALDNRLMMLTAILEGLSLPFDAERLINENHNHATVMKDGVLHRKGATPAEKNQLGVIPINQRDGTYITRGLGNAEFLWSASHGAGRVLSRAQAKKRITPRTLASQMEGIICRVDGKVCDEGPDAYKPASEVLAAQEGLLIDVVDHFAPLLVVKG